MCFSEATFEYDLNFALEVSRSWWEVKVRRGQGLKMLLSKVMTCLRKAAQHLHDSPS